MDQLFTVKAVFNSDHKISSELGSILKIRIASFKLYIGVNVFKMSLRLIIMILALKLFEFNSLVILARSVDGELITLN